MMRKRKVTEFNMGYKLTRADDGNEFRHLFLELVDLDENHNDVLLKLSWQSDDRNASEPHEQWYGCHVELSWQKGHSIDGIEMTLRMLRYALPKDWHDKDFTYIDPRLIVEHIQSKRIPRAYHDPRSTVGLHRDRG